jgi:hypothetical protein
MDKVIDSFQNEGGLQEISKSYKYFGLHKI